MAKKSEDPRQIEAFDNATLHQPAPSWEGRNPHDWDAGGGGPGAQAVSADVPVPAARAA